MEWEDRRDEYIPQVERALDIWVPYVNDRLGIPLRRPEVGAFYPGYHGQGSGAMRFYERGEGLIEVAADKPLAPFTIFHETMHELGHVTLHQHGFPRQRDVRRKWFGEGVSEHFSFDGMDDIGGVRGALFAARQRAVNRYGFRIVNREYQVGYNKIERLRREGASLKDIIKDWEWFLQEM